jgi:hypothetical protein
LAFDATRYDIETWLTLENDGLLQKECDVYTAEGLLAEQYKTRVKVKPVGQTIYNSGGKLSVAAPALWRSFTYDEAGNKLASLPEMREWTQACEDAAQGVVPDDGDSIVNISKSATQYEAFDVSSVPIGTTVSLATKQLQPDEYLFLRHVMVSGDCIAKFQVVIDGSVLATKRTWWTKWNEDFWFNSSNGGIIYQNEELIEVRVTNLGEYLGDFEASIGIV